MRNNFLHRILFFAIAIAMVLSISPVPAVAAADGGTSGRNAQTSEIGEAVYQSVEAIEAVLYRYWDPVSVPAENIETFVSAMDEDTYFSALIDFEDTNFLLQDLIQIDTLNDAERTLLEASSVNYDRFWFALVDRAESEQLFETYASSGSIGGLSITSSNTSGSVSTGGDAAAGTGTATVSIKATGGFASSKTAESTFTFLNTSDSTLQVTLTYSISDATSYKFNGNANAASGSFSIKLATNASFTVDLKATGAAFYGTQTAKCEITKLSVQKVLDSAQLSVDYDSSLGTLKDAAGNVIGANTPVTVTSAGMAVTAYPATGCNFVAWVEPGTNKFISSAVKREFSPTAATMTAKAIFSDGTPWFIVNGDTLVEGWDAAMAYGGTVVLANNATLAARDTAYHVPSKVNLLIPFSDSDVGTFGAIPQSTALESTANPSCFRTLTVASGAVITVDGKLNVNGQRNVANQGSTGTGTAKGGHGVIDLQGTGTQLTVNSGAVLTCYGFIKGTGGVTMGNGSALHELLQIYDWGGGSNLSGWYTSLGSSMDQTLFFTSHYYVQNVEAPLTVNYGSALYAETVLTVSGVQILSSAQVVGTESTENALFKLGSGTTLSRTYKPATDRVEYYLHGGGTSTFGSLNVKVKVVFEVELNSKDFILPVNNAMTVRIGSGVTINMGNRLALMPGSKLIIDKGGVLNQSANLFIFDKADKTSDLFYQGLLAPKYTASRGTTSKITSITESARLEVNGTLNVSGSGGIYTTSNGGTNTDKIIYGIGTINHTGTTGSGALRGGYTSSYVTIKTVDALANLAGDGDMVSIGKATYIGLGADHGNKWYINSADVAATCVDNAYTKYYCSSADDYYAVENANTATGIHTEAIDAAVSATCLGPGLTEGKHCAVCNEVLVAQEETTALGHDWSDATCTEAKTCKTCGETEGDALGHDWAEATCTEAKTCKICGKTEGEALGHDWADATCTEAKTCKTCGETEGDALGHDWSDATCTEPKTCKTCGETEGKALGHTYGEPVWSWTGNDTDGYTAASAAFTCTVCEEDTQTITDSGIGVVTTDATTDAEGSIVYTAEVTFNDQTYSDTKTVVIPKVEIELNPVVDKTGTTTPANITAPEGGWVLGENTFSVICEKACVVAYTTIGEDGETVYNRLTATAAKDSDGNAITDEDGNALYSFTVTLEDDTQIYVYLSGDVNGDGKVNSRDESVITCALLYEGHARRVELSELNKLIADVNVDGKFNSRDESTIICSLLYDGHARQIVLNWTKQ